jgi:hypothetical protein
MRATRGAMKQADTKILFKAGDRARDGRCLGIRGNCSFRKAADLYRSHEHTQCGQIVHFGVSVSPLRRNVEHSPDQTVPATFRYSRGLRLISPGTPTFVCAFRNNHFRLRELGPTPRPPGRLHSGSRNVRQKKTGRPVRFD